MKSMIANFFTISRIILSLMMLIFQVFSPGFYVCYLLSGITDMVDGTVARKLGTVSEFGAKLDTIADFIFVLAALYKLLPATALNRGIWIWIGIIAVIKVINIISGFVVQKRILGFQCRKYVGNLVGNHDLFWSKLLFIWFTFIRCR